MVFIILSMNTILYNASEEIENWNIETRLTKSPLLEYRIISNKRLGLCVKKMFIKLDYVILKCYFIILNRFLHTHPRLW